MDGAAAGRPGDRGRPAERLPPYAIAVERLLSAGVPPLHGLAVLAAYALIYSAPGPALLVAGLVWGPRVRPRLAGLQGRLRRDGELPRRVPAAIGPGVAAAAVLGLAVTTWGGAGSTTPTVEPAGARPGRPSIPSE